MNAAIAPGASLQAARTEQGLTIEQAAESLRIGNDVLRLLEADQFESFSSLLYVGAYLRPYAELLSLDPEPLLKAVLVICGVARPTRLRFAVGAERRTSPRPTARRAARRPPPRGRSRLRLAAAVAVAGALAGAAGGLLASPGVGLRLDARRVQELAARLTAATAADAPAPTPQLREAEPLAKRIAPPPPPPRLTVQVLDGSGDGARAQAVAGRLRALGYDVVATDTLRRRSRRTAVLAAEGSQAQAAALIAQDRRFGEVRIAPAFKVPAALHVVVGSDWPSS